MKGDSMAIMSAKAIASEFGCDAKYLRKFLRSNSCDIEGVGKGGRYAIESRSMRKLRNQFDSWHAARKGANASQSGDAPESDVALVMPESAEFV